MAYSDSESSSDDAKETAPSSSNTFKLFSYISQSPTVVGIQPQNWNEKKYKEVLWDAYLQHKNKLENILEVLFTMNSIQRNHVVKTWTSRRDGGGTDLQSVLKDFFSELKNEQLSLRLLLSMLKNLDQLDAEWIHDALYDSNENNKKENDELMIEIICTRTYKQLRELSVSYKKRYKKDLLNDMKLKYRKTDSNFVKMAENLLSGERDENVLIKPEIEELTADVKVFSDALKQNKIPLSTLKELGVTLTTRSWRHIHDLCPVYAQLVGYNLQTSLQHKLSTQLQLPSNLAMVRIVEISRSIHFYFAKRLSIALKSTDKKLISRLHRIVLSRCEIDLGAISNLFASKVRLCDNKTLKQWITEKISNKKQPIHRKILLFLCGLHKEDVHVDIAHEHDVYYVANQDAYIGSVRGLDATQFNVQLDVQSMMNWMHPIQDGEATKDERKRLKDKMAKLLCNRNATQRAEIARLFRSKHKHAIMDYLTIIIKKGCSLKMMAYLLTSIVGCNIMRLRECIDNRDMNGICDILCVATPSHLKAFVSEYKRRFHSSMVGEIEGTCNRLKKGLLWRLFSALLSNKRYQEYMSATHNKSVNVKRLARDIKFLRSFNKKTKNVKENIKNKFVDMFCLNNKHYIRALNLQFQQISHDYNLTYLIDRILGKNSCAAYAVKVILSYSIAQTEYFAQKIFHLGKKNWKKYEEEIGFIFISRSEIDLYSIQLAFHDNLYAEGKLLTQWVGEKTSESKTGLFFVLLLQSLAKNKNAQQQTSDTLRAISIGTNTYSNVPFGEQIIHSTTPTPFFGGVYTNHGLTLGAGFGHSINLISPKQSTTSTGGFHMMDAYVEDNVCATAAEIEEEPALDKKQSKSKSKSQQPMISPPKKEKKKKERVEVKSRGDSNVKMKKLSKSARQEMAKKIMNTLTKKVKLSDIDIKQKNNKIEPEELFEFLKRKKITVPRYISNIVFADIDMNGDGHITMFEYFKWKSKVSVDRMYAILPNKIPDIDDDDAYYLEEGIPNNNNNDNNTTAPEDIKEEKEKEKEEDDDLKRLDDKLILYKKLLNLTIKNGAHDALNRNIFSAYCKRNEFGLNKSQIYRIFEDMDYDCDGKISPAEYFKWRDKISIGYLNELLSTKEAQSTPPEPPTAATAAASVEIEEERKTDNSDGVESVDSNGLRDISCSPYSAKDYSQLETQITILVDENRKKWSQYLLNPHNELNAKLSFIEFVDQHLSSKIVTQLFKKFGANGVVESDGFAELLAFTYTLYRAKLQREHYKNDATFKKWKNKVVRPKIEHFVIWVIRTFGNKITSNDEEQLQTVHINDTESKQRIEVGEYNEYKFVLNKESYAKDLKTWIQEYIKKKADHEDQETAWMILMIWQQ